jgi:CTP:molybdopterin cytidylyltransferase MocA
MDAIICNAGKGSRLGALGIHRRKCLFRDPHADKSILWYQLDALHELGVQRTVIMTPPADTQIQAEVLRLHDRHPGMEIVCVPVDAANVLESIQAGLAHVRAERVVRLDGDVCVLNRSDLLGVREVAGNAICCFESDPAALTPSTPVVRDGRVSFWTPGDAPSPVWSCIDVWRREDLARVVEHPGGEGGVFFFERVNRFQQTVPAATVGAVSIPPVYEIDTPEDVDQLIAVWGRHAAALEEESLRYWTGLEAYPTFTVDKEAQWAADVDLVLEHLNEGDRLLELAAGTGRLAASLLSRAKVSHYAIVEPNPNWSKAIAERFAGETVVEVFTKTVAGYVEGNGTQAADLAVAFGWAPYMIHDDSLHGSLARLRCTKLLLKAPEPPQERFSRLRVDHFSKELGARYISLYRSASETCRLVRNAGWLVRELRRNVYPDHIESAYGSRTFLIVAERP